MSGRNCFVCLSCCLSGSFDLLNGYFIFGNYRNLCCNEFWRVTEDLVYVLVGEKERAFLGSMNFDQKNWVTVIGSRRWHALYEENLI